jgi:hypothetical protein
MSFFTDKDPEEKASEQCPNPDRPFLSKADEEKWKKQ